MDILKAASTLRPGTAWNLTGDVLSQAIDGTPRVLVPTMQELQPVMDSDVYIENRVKEYPSIGDQMDAIWKGGKDQSDMAILIASIKTKYPKS